MNASPDNVLEYSAAEIAATLDLYDATTRTEREVLGLHRLARTNVLAIACRADKSILMNRTLGPLPPDEALVKEICDFYRCRGVARAFVSVSEALVTPPLPTLLERAGLKEARAWTKFRRPATPAQPPDTELHVKKIDSRDAEAFGRIATQGFGMPDDMAPVLARLPSRENWHVYMSFNGTAPAGCGALYCHGKTGWLGWAATDSQYRCRGSQRAVMAARINAAIDGGCTQLTTETGEAVPGDPQHSWNNILRLGFEPVVRIRNFALTP